MTKKNLKYKKVVIKIGTKVITSKDTKLDKRQVKALVKQIAFLLKKNVEVVLVSSGAIASGMNILGLKTRPASLPLLQASAAIGQNQLMKIYNRYFHKNGIIAAQLLLTQNDLSDRKRYLNIKNTIASLLSGKVIPIINENDTVATDEIKFGDNDRLSALVANLIGVDCLIMLTDVDGLCFIDSNKKMVRIEEVKEIGDKIEKLIFKSSSCISVGGMRSKLEAAKIAASSGIRCIIANGRRPDILLKIMRDEQLGTTFLPLKLKLKERKKWIAFSVKPKGRVIVDKGAKAALKERNKSLLSAGIIEVKGDFKYGDLVSVMDKEHHEFARGLINYSSKELNLIKGERTGAIEKILGYKYYDEIMHRDNLVIL